MPRARENTVIRLHADERALVERAAELVGEPFGTFGRLAMLATARQVLEGGTVVSEPEEEVTIPHA